MKYYGNAEADKYIHENFIRKPFVHGTFLELGAIDGIEFSNTKFFEDNMGFDHGVLIEPDPQSFESLKKNRPNAKCFHCAIHESKKSADFLISDQNAVGCLAEESSEEFKNRWHKESKIITVPCYRLDHVLDESKLSYIDLWSLDVEGAEMHCLNSMNWDIPVGLIVVEINENADEISDILERQGFQFVSKYKRDGYYFNYNYCRRDLFSLL